jgi:putative acetyltransferase
MFDIRPADLTNDQTCALLSLHMAGMRENSPPGSVFALDLSGLRRPDMRVWTCWANDRVAGIGALRLLGEGCGEVKSMRTHPDYLRRGVGAALLVHIITEARKEQITRLSLETGSGPAFNAALALYRRHGFMSGEAFGDYEKSAFNQFFHMTL